MSKNEERLKVGRYNSAFNEILGVSLEELDIYQSQGLKTHMIKRKHFTCLRYINDIPEIIMNPEILLSS